MQQRLHAGGWRAVGPHRACKQYQFLSQSPAHLEVVARLVILKLYVQALLNANLRQDSEE
jgi:hypothetical protein